MQLARNNVIKTVLHDDEIIIEKSKDELKITGHQLNKTTFKY
jgi:hypothetical protein